MQIMPKDRKGISGQLGILVTGAILMVVVVVVIAFGAQFLSSLGSGFSANTPEKYIVSNGTDSLLKIGTQTPNIALVVVLVVIISLLLFVAYRFMAR